METYIPETSIGHGESGRSSTILSLHDLITTELYALDQLGQLVLGDLHSRLGLAEQWHDSLARVTTNDWNGEILRVVCANDGCHEGLSADNIESGNAKESLGVEDTL